MNSDLSDIASGLTGSLARNGEGGMTDKLSFVASGWNYTTDLTTGMYRYSASTQRIKAAGTDIVEIGPSGFRILVGSGGIPIGLGPLPWSGLTAPTGWLLVYGQAILRSTYADLWTFAAVEIAAGNTFYGVGNGSTTFTVGDARGRGIFGKDNMGGSAASRLTTAGGGVDGLTLGAVGGSQSHTNTIGEMVNHAHADGAATPSFTYGGGGSGAVPTPANTGGVSGALGSPYSIMNPGMVCNLIIYAGV